MKVHYPSKAPVYSLYGVTVKFAIVISGGVGKAIQEIGGLKKNAGMSCK